MKARHAIIRTAFLLVINGLFVAFYFFIPDAKLNGWILTALAGIFTSSDTALYLVLKGFDDLEADPSLSPGAFRRLRAALHKRRGMLTTMLPLNVFFRVTNAVCGVILVNRPEIPAAYPLLIAGYLCASFGLQSCMIVLVNLFDIYEFKSNQTAEGRAAEATKEHRSKLGNELKGLAIY